MAFLKQVIKYSREDSFDMGIELNELGLWLGICIIIMVIMTVCIAFPIMRRKKYKSGKDVIVLHPGITKEEIQRYRQYSIETQPHNDVISQAKTVEEIYKDGVDKMKNDKFVISEGADYRAI